MTSRLAEIARKEGIPVEIILETGKPDDNVINAAKSRKCSLIAIGLRGQRRTNNIRSLGDDSRHILEGAPCPVIVVA